MVIHASSQPFASHNSHSSTALSHDRVHAWVEDNNATFESILSYLTPKRKRSSSASSDFKTPTPRLEKLPSLSSSAPVEGVSIVTSEKGTFEYLPPGNMAPRSPSPSSQPTSTIAKSVKLKVPQDASFAARR